VIGTEPVQLVMTQSADRQIKELKRQRAISAEEVENC
jgi:hypothetical protein